MARIMGTVRRRRKEIKPWFSTGQKMVLNVLGSALVTASAAYLLIWLYKNAIAPGLGAAVTSGIEWIGKERRPGLALRTDMTDLIFAKKYLGRYPALFRAGGSVSGEVQNRIMMSSSNSYDNSMFADIRVPFVGFDWGNSSAVVTRFEDSSSKPASEPFKVSECLVSVLIWGVREWHVYAPGHLPLEGYDPRKLHDEWVRGVLPSLKSKRRPIVVLQEPGEAVYVPQGYHYAWVSESGSSGAVEHRRGHTRSGGVGAYLHHLRVAEAYLNSTTKDMPYVVPNNTATTDTATSTGADAAVDGTGDAETDPYSPDLSTPLGIAIQAVVSAERLLPEDLAGETSVLRVKGVLLLLRDQPGDRRLGNKAFREAVRLNRRDVGLYEEWARALSQVGDSFGAIKVLEAAREKGMDSSELKAIEKELGWAAAVYTSPKSADGKSGGGNGKRKREGKGQEELILDEL